MWRLGKNIWEDLEREKRKENVIIKLKSDIIFHIISDMKEGRKSTAIFRQNENIKQKTNHRAQCSCHILR